MSSFRQLSVPSRVGIALAVAGGGFISYIGLSYLAAPQSIAPGFGFRQWPAGDADGFYAIKGIRDVATGLVLFVLLAMGQRRAAAIVMAVLTVIPLGDAMNVVAHDGSVATALGVHTLTAAMMMVSSALMLGGLRAEQSHPVVDRLPVAV
ncbi:DUF4267 domain-containing protein [Williamsia sterculiae]|uniref:DUF4267 domain-containing protein n=1 Tax=Williamsia sterculiae TaxID=1344003 RepID=A0A1N7DJ92_9NOCA|nr:DUF4267 domain-containing protein [Williamsia sterculiae]SIR75876.1 protein of unknown function [Williamsia sterculiae]